MNLTRLPALLLVYSFSIQSPAAELVVLSPANHGALAPQGKEADAIFGDYLLKNDRIAIVVAAPGAQRDANLTVRNVGGSLIDMTALDKQSDQLSCLYPGGGGFRFERQADWPFEWSAPATAAKIAFEGNAISLEASQRARPLRIVVGYELRDGEPFVRLHTTISNTGDGEVDVNVADGIRADGEFKFGIDYDADLFWAYDLHWQQAYGFQTEGLERQVMRGKKRGNRIPREIIYPKRGIRNAETTLDVGQSVSWSRRVFAAKDNVSLQSIAYTNRETQLVRGEVILSDGVDPIENAQVRVIITPPEGGEGERVSLGVGLTDSDGRYGFNVPAADYAIRVTAEGHNSVQEPLSLSQGDNTLELELSAPSYVEGAITNDSGQPIPAKIQLIGLDDTRSPNWGPESAVRGVGNLQYTPDGRFSAKLRPGKYRWLASHGPEYDAAEGTFTVARRETAPVSAALARTVNTTGWISSELHSHSSPSGDNTASQRGRVLNLLAEQLEFCPCTEHQRIDVYDEHLAHFDAADRMLTCPGMELTGSPLPLNHQNAFPLIHKPHHQHGGGPSTDPDPVKQIERLATWDNNSLKMVQTNHPNIAQLIGDRDLDGTADAGFEKMFGFMDAIEIHPPELIFEPLGPAGDPNSGVGNGGWEGRGNVIQNWLQLLNLGYRVTGVVNTDAHYNLHGSGWLRNWVRSSTDNPAEASVDELIHEFEHGHVVVSNGPYLMVEARAKDDSAIPGDDLTSLEHQVTFRVVVRCPNWIEVNRVQFFINGRPYEEHNYTVRSHGDWFNEGPEVFDQEIKLKLDGDAHVVVACCGEGRQLGVIYGEKFGAVMPTAVANPIFIDTDGDADGDGVRFEHNGDGLGLPLPAAQGLVPSHGHGHPNHW